MNPEERYTHYIMPKNSYDINFDHDNSGDYIMGLHDCKIIFYAEVIIIKGFSSLSLIRMF